jgi:hypothetical protein
MSQLERLVEHNMLPHQPLDLQCRMREEFVPMFQNIYPYLQSHLALVFVTGNAAPTCMENTVLFWSHTFAEGSQHSNVNQGEAHMVVALARCTALELENPKGLKILAAYNGQVGILTPW